MDLLRVYLLIGLLTHKAVWEAMKRMPGAPAGKPLGKPSLKIRLVKAAKMAILAGIIVQVLIGDVLPMAEDPAGVRLAGAILFTLGLGIALIGRIQLGSNWLDIESAGVKNTQRVIASGIYSFVRHPIYVGDLILLLGLELALNSWLVFGVVLLIPVVLRQAVSEERLLVSNLPGYDLYCRRTKRFIPFLA